MNGAERSFTERFLGSFYLKIFLFPQNALQRSRCPLAVYPERVFQDCSIKSKLQLCQLKAQNRKNFHSMLLCTFYLKIYLFPLQALQHLECPLALSTKRVPQNCSIKGKLELCQLNAQNRKKFHRIFLCQFLFEDIPFFPMGPLALGVSTRSFYRKSVSGLLNQK